MPPRTNTHGLGTTDNTNVDVRRQITDDRQADEIFRLVVEAAPNAIVLADEDGRILLVNAGAERLFGYSRGELTGQPVEMLVPERFRAAHAGYRRGYAGHAETRPMGKGRDLFALRKDGTEVPVEIGLNPIQTTGGSLILSVIVDISDRKQAEEAQRAGEERLRIVTENARVGLVMVDRERRYTFANRAYAEILGLPPADLVGQRVADVLAPLYEAQIQPRLDRAFAGERVTYELQRATPTAERYYAVRYEPTEVDGEVSLVVVAITEITERKHAEESQVRLAAIVNSSDDAIIGKTLDGIITNWNPGAEKVFGYSAAEAVGQPMLMLFPTDQVEEEREILRRIGRGESVDHFDTVRVRKDGKQIDVSITISPIADSEGNIVGASKIARDITERKRAEKEIRMLNAELEERVKIRTAELEAANKELEAFSYSVSHDLRSPLRTVDGFAQIVLEDFGSKLPSEGQHALQTICDGARRMGALIDDLLTFSRLSRAPLNKREVDAERMVRDVLADPASEQEGRKIDFRVGKLPSCSGDPALLKQVWINLLSNACKYTSQREMAVIEVGSREEGGETVYFVRDNGTGFDMRYVGKLFGVFQRLHRAEDYAGTGVGLAIVQRVVHRHGGRVWAEAALDRGATFYFTLGGTEKP